MCYLHTACGQLPRPGPRQWTEVTGAGVCCALRMRGGRGQDAATCGVRGVAPPRGRAERDTRDIS